MKETYRVVFQGKVIKEAMRDHIKERAGEFLNIKESEKIDLLFSGKRIILKKNIDHAAALSLKKRFLRFGAVVDVEPTVETGKKPEGPESPIEENPPRAVSAREKGRSRVVGDDFRKIFREIHEVNSCFTTAGFFRKERYRLAPDIVGFYGTFENGRTYENWLWKDVVPLGDERPVAFFRKNRSDLSGIFKRRGRWNTITIVFTEKKCYLHQEKDGIIESFRYSQVREAREDGEAKSIEITLRNGRSVSLPLENSNLCSYFLALRDGNKNTAWQKEQVGEEKEYHLLLLTTLFTSVLTLGLLIFYGDEDPSGAAIMGFALQAVIPAWVVAWIVLTIYRKLRGR